LYGRKYVFNGKDSHLQQNKSAADLISMSKIAAIIIIIIMIFEKELSLRNIKIK